MTNQDEQSKAIQSEIAKENKKVVSAFCDMCGNQETDSRENLRREGWGLYPASQFCPKHESDL